MIDLTPSQAFYYWTFDKFDDLKEYREKEEFGKLVWKRHEISSYAINPDFIAFDRPEEVTEGPAIRLDKGTDGLYYQSGDDLTHEAVRSDTSSHVVMTGNWTEKGVGKGAFVGVFPRQMST